MHTFTNGTNLNGPQLYLITWSPTLFLCYVFEHRTPPPWHCSIASIRVFQAVFLPSDPTALIILLVVSRIRDAEVALVA